MKCAVHPEAEATGFCRNCGKAMCPQCTREMNGALYCEQCVSPAAVSPLLPPPVANPRGPNPGLAATLGFIPGLGAVYNGEYVKALIHVLVFAGLIAAMASDPNSGTLAFVIVAFIAFCFYMPVDAYRVAKARRAGEAEPGLLAERGSRRPVGAIVLIVIGVLILLRNFDVLDLDWVGKAWPIGLIALGAWLVWSRVKEGS
jgi:hypothetical protein